VLRCFPSLPEVQQEHGTLRRHVSAAHIKCSAQQNAADADADDRSCDRRVVRSYHDRDGAHLVPIAVRLSARKVATAESRWCAQPQREAEGMPVKRRPGLAAVIRASHNGRLAQSPSAGQETGDGASCPRSRAAACNSSGVSISTKSVMTNPAILDPLIEFRFKITSGRTTSTEMHASHKRIYRTLTMAWQESTRRFAKV
jgi:hypothetical protein